MKVFISYTYDDEKHSDRVLALSNQLREDGVDCWIDQYEKGLPKKDWPLWMEEKVEESRYTLVVCTAIYHKRFYRREDSGKGKGATWEGAIITNQIYNSYCQNTKFIPVVFSEDDLDKIPTILKGTTNFILKKKYEDLLRLLTGQPKAEPKPVGSIKKLSKKNEKILELDPEDPFEEFIQDRIKQFIPCEYFLDEIQNFIERQEKGFVSIEGKGGIGKSALLSYYIKTINKDCIYHFNFYKDGISTPEYFMRSISEKLIDKYEIEYQIPENLSENVDLFYSLLRQAGKKALANGKKLVIVIDALDEVNTEKENDLSNNLRLPTNKLPKGVFFVLTSRGIKYLPNDSLLLSMDNKNKELKETIRKYIEYADKNNEEVHQWRLEQNLGLEEFTNKLEVKSEHNFMYLCHVFGDLKAFRLNELPKGLESYYNQQVDRMEIQGEEGEKKTKILSCLAAFSREISIFRISQLTGFGLYEINRAISGWCRQKILTEIKINGETFLKVYHKAFNDFLLTSYELRHASKERELIEYSQKLFGEDDWEYGFTGQIKGLPEVLQKEYLELLTFSLIEAKKKTEILKVLKSKVFLLAKLKLCYHGNLIDDIRGANSLLSNSDELCREDLAKTLFDLVELKDNEITFETIRHSLEGFDDDLLGAFILIKSRIQNEF